MIKPQDTDKMMCELASDATYFRPRLFALYGISHRDGNGFLGWGMEFADGGAIFHDPHHSTTWRSDSAEQVLRTHQRINDARLDWLD